MSSPYTGSGVRPTEIAVPTDDDDAGVASVAVPIEQLADGVFYEAGVNDGQDATLAAHGSRLTALELSWQWAQARGGGGSTSAHGAYLHIDALTTGIGGLYTLVTSNLVEVPAVGEYEIHFSAAVKCTDTTNPIEFQYSLEVGAGNQLAVMRQWRRSATAGDYVTASASVITKITTAPASNRIGLKMFSSTAAGTFEPYDYLLAIRRIK